MEKLKKYNQILLAFLGTVVLFWGLLGLIYVAFEFLGHTRHDSPEPQLLAEEQVKKLAADSIRKQIISFNRAELIDTTRLFYLIPVDQAQLDKAEKYGSTNRNKSHYLDDSDYHTPAHNNILFYNGINKTTYPLFKKRVSINSYETFYSGKQIVAHFAVTDTDSNHDGFMSHKDLQKLYIFLPEFSRFLEIEAVDKTFYSLQRLGKTDDFIAKYGLDRDKNGQFDHEIEPFVFYRLNLQEGKLVDIIPDTLIEQLQRRLDGREN